MKIDSSSLELVIVQVAATVLCFVQGRLGWFFVQPLVILLFLSVIAFPIVAVVRACILHGSPQSIVWLLASILLSIFQAFSLAPTVQ
jgi:hypothetical protein